MVSPKVPSFWYFMKSKSMTLEYVVLGIVYTFFTIALVNMSCHIYKKETRHLNLQLKMVEFSTSNALLFLRYSKTLKRSQTLKECSDNATTDREH